MRLSIGSSNPVKVVALQEILNTHSHFRGATLLKTNVPSGVSEQPFTLEETILGAKNRARNAFNQEECLYSFGVESGIFKADHYFNICACSIYNGKDYFMGFSSAFTIPDLIIDLMKLQNLDLSKACFQLGLTENENIGSAEGLIGILTKGKIDRKEYTKQAIQTALAHFENATIF
jgi:inosine/xanthosine triphosphatase